MSNQRIFFDAGPDGAPVAFSQPRQLIVVEEPDQISGAFAALKAAEAAGYWIAGYASYELGYALIDKLAPLMPAKRDTPLMMFGVFDAPAPRPDYQRGGVELGPPVPMWDGVSYRAAFDRLHAYIGAGDTYQINLTFPMKSELKGDPEALFAALEERQPVGHGAFVDLGYGPTILSRSPELFFQTRADGKIESRPMKGTIARGLTEAEDAARRNWLHNDPKNRAENLMIVDLLRNDISQVSEIGSVQVPDLFGIETYATVHQMVSKVSAQLKPSVSFRDQMEALFPCGSITGAPKIRAMEIIRELEPDPRGIYCGAIGWRAPDGRSSFNVAIRTLSIFGKGQVRLNVGGGVVWDSTAPSEYEEALLKSRYAKAIQ